MCKIYSFRSAKRLIWDYHQFKIKSLADLMKQYKFTYRHNKLTLLISIKMDKYDGRGGTSFVDY